MPARQAVTREENPMFHLLFTQADAITDAVIVVLALAVSALQVHHECEAAR
jgi:hypothetical protein